MLWTFFEDVESGWKCLLDDCNTIFKGEKTAKAAKAHLNTQKHIEKTREIVSKSNWDQKR